MIGQILGDYEVLEEIGRGGMGIVYRAQHLRLHRPVALKRLHPRFGADPERRRRFLQEAQAASALNHPGIVTVHDILRHGDDDLLVMEWVDGLSLDRHISENGLDWRQVVALAWPLCQAMAAAHAAGIVHRDLKPSNIMLPGGLESGRIKVLDFGIAKILAEAAANTPASHEHTRDGEQLGTPAYMAPEQLLGETVGRHTDIFALGVLLYEMLCGRRPFEGPTPAARHAAILHEEPEALLQLRPDIPRSVADWVLACLAKQPTQRPASMEALADGLEALQPQGVSTQTPTTAGNALQTLVALRWNESTVQSVVAAAAAPPLDHSLRELAEQHGGWLHGDWLHGDWLHGDSLHDDLSSPWLRFELPWDGVRFALALQRLALDQAIEVQLGLHVGPVTIQEAPATDDAIISDTGSTSASYLVHADGLALHVCRQLAQLAVPGQTLLTRPVFDLARRGAERQDAARHDLAWLAHGTYVLTPPSGEAEEVAVFEVGDSDTAPLRPPEGSPEMRRVPQEGHILGWRPAPGMTIPGRSNWIIERRLGTGGAGDVWLARHQKTHQPRAFKFCYARERLRTLQREITVFRLLQDELGARQDIAELIDWNLDEAPYYLESAYTPDGSLVDWCAEPGRLDSIPRSVRLDLMAQVATALAAAHSVGVLHKDIKPANILIKESPGEPPHAMLTDFGIGRILEPQRLAQRDITLLGLSVATEDVDGTSLSGTQLYMAPELLTGRAPSIQSDIYAFGVMLYQVVVGDLQRPLAAGWERDVDGELLRQDIAECVDGQPDRRPRSASEAADKLRRLESRQHAAQARQRALEDAAEAERQAEAEARRAARHRRVLRYAALASTLVLVVVSLLAGQALRARAEAERQQAQAEQLVDLLLGDLHDDLEKIGRLDLLEQAARGSLRYFDRPESPQEATETQLKRGLTLLNIGDVLLKQGDTDAAQAAYDDASVRFRSADDDLLEARDGHRRSQLKQALALSKQGHLAPAVIGARDALALTAGWPEAREPRPIWHASMADCQYWICHLEDRSGNRSAALEACDASLSHLDAAAGDPTVAPESLPWRLNLLRLNSHILRGGIRRVLKQTEEAFADLNTARQLARHLARHDPANAQWTQKLAWVHFQLAVLHLFHRQDPQAALDDLSVARRVYQQLIDIDPGQTRWRDNLAETLNLLGRIELQRDQPRAAIALFGKAVDVLEPMVADDPNHRQRLGALARIQQSIGRAHTAVGHIDRATAAFGQAVELNRRVVEVTGDATDPVNFLAWSHVVLGDSHALAGDRAQAQRHWQQAVTLITPVTAVSQTIEYRDTHAQALLKLGHLEQARPWVQGLLADGWQDPSFLQLVQDAGLAASDLDMSDLDTSDLDTSDLDTESP